MITASCENCGKEFQTWPCRLERGGGRYCSRKRAGDMRRGKRFTEEHRAKIATALTRGHHKACDQCGKLFWVKPSEPARFCSHPCCGAWQSEHLSGPRSSRWKGGVMANGYRMIGRKLEHRQIIESLLERPLEQDETVHHIDEDRANNDPKNLMLFASKGCHRAHHTTGSLDGLVFDGRTLEAVWGCR